MRISRLTVDKLGVKLYDRVSAVIAELIANCYDADATSVKVSAPMDQMLATKSGGELIDRGFCIEVRDNGAGMTPGEIDRFYLKVGGERRADPERGPLSREYRRKVMGRKGVGKLAAFGICNKVEVVTSGGQITRGLDAKGKPSNGYRTAHFVMERSEILTDTDRDYHPRVGELDGTVSTRHGTVIRLSSFDHRRVPGLEEFARQLSQRFGLPTANWKVVLRDSTKTPPDPLHERDIGSFSIEKMDDTNVLLEGAKGAIGPDGAKLDNIEAGFNHEEKFYPVTGWVAYSMRPYKDDLMAGVRIYCRGKIAAQTHVFNLKAGFTGEYDVRSYLIGEIHADWLDEGEDLIRTDRQDILWSHELGRAFETWGQSLIKRIGTITRQPKRKKAWQLFQEASNIQGAVQGAFPGQAQEAIRTNTVEIAKLLAQTTREDELLHPEVVRSILDLSLLLGPHITLDRKLREAAEDTDDTLSAITGILKTARIAELSGFGRIAEDRVRVIMKVEELKSDPETLESAFQSLLAEAPWLVNPQWSPISANQSFTTIKNEFQKFYEERTGTPIALNDFTDPAKRADFVMSSQDATLQLIEIKKPGHSLANEEMARINNYKQIMEEFLKAPGNREFISIFNSFHITLVCDKIGLTGVYKTALDGLEEKKILTQISWPTFLLRTRRMHEEFLTEAERQKRDAATPE